MMFFATTTDTQRLGDRLHHYMKATGHDIHSLGEALGLSGATIMTFLDGGSWPLESTLLKFAELEAEVDE
ncbi:helix-turn-helix domain-containing protein (plasmid) [Picosynechococcus sp. PCC 11901]|uniref:helix-turn-helix domain-containing protein n=1 Tax=Picosynechococcus sp. PCC 11901 TaxID=2579791 RepID=UPI0010FC013F|nr:helix-turn-helix domain-containing protein [Picosynechococcus sp. PCC 11901]QCS47962.1 helix-turn-helix domain-containing protein [Picosynechococcus sp. PCC 11901]QCS48022.1 helix-turn-helix domain-containing protein [Picosynechococcus sp. PCC 11901]